MSRNWTAEQLQAITARGGSLLVSAAAGSGKTAVLVERVIRRIADPVNPVDADKLAVVTFSNAAAAEIRERVDTALSALLAECPDDYGLRRQQMLLAKAHICTIHSFCMDVIRQNFQQLAVSPDFRIGDENELALLRAEAAAEVVEEYYAGGNEAFFALVEMVSSGRDDKRLMQTVERLHTFVRSHPFPEHWLEQKLTLYDPDIPVSASVWGQTILAYTEQAMTHWAHQLRQALLVIEGDGTLAKAYAVRFNEDAAYAGKLLDAAKNGEWDTIYKALRGYEFGSLGAARGFDDKALKERLLGTRNGFKAAVKALRERQFCATEAQHREDMLDLLPKITVLFELVKAYAARYEEKKRDRNLLDFTDLEQLALKLLVQSENGQTVRTEVARSLSQSIEEIFIDEYQDVNEVQNEIFKAISREEQNLFMVGDVKQSIYRFRQAMPELFLHYKEVFAPFDEQHFPAKITLGRNFRSRSGVTSAVNFIFTQIMSRKMGEIEYAGDELLIPAAVYPETRLPQVTLDVVDASQLEDDETAAQLEARHIAGQIKKLLSDGLMVTENGALRRASFRDIAILLRSVKGKAQVYANELEACGIPVYSDTSGDYFKAREVAVMLSLLRTVDNPLSDIDLVAVMLSPMFAFTATELSAIRLANPRAPLYLAAAVYAKESEKAAQLLQTLEKLRTAAVSLSPDRLIEYVYTLTGYDLMVLAMPNGLKRLANLRLLSEYARGYEQSGCKTLAGLVRLFNRMMEQGLSLGEAPAFADTADVVRILSMHKSKGLEFPVCFVADCSKQFNRQDLNEPSLLHSTLGFSCKRREPESLKQYTTVPQEALKLEISKGMLSEEMRILYVALTRAKEYLYIVTAEKKPDKRLAKLAENLTDSVKLNPFTVQGAQSFSDWILTAALRKKEAACLRELAGLDDSCVLPDDGVWQVRLITPAAPENKQTEAAEETAVIVPKAASADMPLLYKLRERIDKVYPFIQSVEIPTKLAVSDIAERQTVLTELRGPSFTFSGGLTPAQKGSALHKFMQFSDYRQASLDLAAEISRMQRQSYLSPEESAVIDQKKLATFFEGALAKRMFASPKLMRELKFISQLDAKEYSTACAESGEDDYIVIQGVADCVFEEDGALVIVDYKTDAVKSAEELIKRYSLQLHYYKRALEQSLAKPVKECVLYSFALGRPISI
ncbi:helicase-exonuclease AddAB subunit AddA [Acetanaerobacterium elongatum]|uniref:DNA 3'-5' helicase n=1 Tax=Acetanaerobacterium elongatum TaxID=258515 RepID=A0A1G9WIF7_9FIRM|nr:helicase-exonuclease AddAB subunit AddA [Acetanaerobacterium elongatum]SDM83825.1 DNA helicase/exodeoxyribonuclease V, subunit A [Acetanaerobacterium elongatum]